MSSFFTCLVLQSEESVDETQYQELKMAVMVEKTDGGLTKSSRARVCQKNRPVKDFKMKNILVVNARP